MLQDQTSKTSRLIEVSALRQLSELSNFRSIGMTLFEWLIVALIISIHQALPHPIIFVLTVIVIGSRMYALYSLMHDGMHSLLIGNKKLNDLFTMLFLSWPLFLSLSRSRSAHLNHHKYLKTEADPEMAHLKYSEFQFPKKKGEFVWILIKDILGINFIVYFLRKRFNDIRSLSKNVKRESLSTGYVAEGILFKVAYYTVVFALIIYFNGALEFVIYWVVPYITVYQALNRIRLTTEHFNLKRDGLFQTRTVKANFFEKLFLFPHNLNHHTEHHLFPSVPFYRLPELSERLMNNEIYKATAYVSNGFREVFKDITASK